MNLRSVPELNSYSFTAKVFSSSQSTLPLRRSAVSLDDLETPTHLLTLDF